MSAINFCDACLAFLQGSWREVKNDESTVKVYMHHETAESFQLALDLKCVICLRLWAAFRRGDAPFLTDKKVTEEVLDMGPTTYDSPASILTLHDTCNVDFYRGHHKARLTLCKWSGKSQLFLVRVRDYADIGTKTSPKKRLAKLFPRTRGMISHSVFSSLNTSNVLPNTSHVSNPPHAVTSSRPELSTWVVRETNQYASASATR
jgi:hypothetical protein